MRTFAPMKNLFVALFVIIAMAACRNRSGAPAEQPSNSTVDSVAETGDSIKQGYLPVADLVKGDIRQVDSFAGGILQRNMIGKKKDSAYIQPAQFHRLAQNFLSAEFDSTGFQHAFSENSFMDESTGLLNFIYTPRKPSMPLRKVVVYISPGLATDQVNRLYMEKEWNDNDTAVSQKLTWKFKAYFMIVTIKQPRQGAVITNITQVIWRPDLFSEEL